MFPVLTKCLPRSGGFSRHALKAGLDALGLRGEDAASQLTLLLSPALPARDVVPATLLCRTSSATQFVSTSLGHHSSPSSLTLLLLCPPVDAGPL